METPGISRENHQTSPTENRYQSTPKIQCNPPSNHKQLIKNKVHKYTINFSLFQFSERFESSSCETATHFQQFQQSAGHSHKFQHQNSVTSSSSIQTVVMNQSCISSASAESNQVNAQMNSSGSLNAILRKNSLSVNQQQNNRLSVSSAEEVGSFKIDKNP
jgi:hypothetical protein